jgi:hypothetical protein
MFPFSDQSGLVQVHDHTVDIDNGDFVNRESAVGSQCGFDELVVGGDGLDQ